MREILFRGKRADNGAWETGSLVRVRVGCHDEKDYIVDKMTGYHTPVIPETIGEYTGLTDKNGTKIFEGDILRYSYEYEGSPWLKGRSLTDEDYRTGVVFWQYWRGSWAVCARGKKQNINQDVYVYCRNPNRVEVIGNIHDNPELLEVRE